MITGLIIYLLAMFGATLSTGLGILLVLRILQGMSAGAASIVSRVVIRDLFAGPEAQRLMAGGMMIFAPATVVAHWLGGCRYLCDVVGAYTVGSMYSTAVLVR